MDFFFFLSFSPWEKHSTDPELSPLKTFNKRLWMTEGSWEEAEGKGWSGKVPAGTRKRIATHSPSKSSILCWAGDGVHRMARDSSTWATNAGTLAAGLWG